MGSAQAINFAQGLARISGPFAPRVAAAMMSVILIGCDAFTDPATRIAYDIEAHVSRLGSEEGARHVIRHATPSKAGECDGPFKVQFDKVGALIIWCKGPGGETVSSHSTTYHGRFVKTERTFIVDKPAGSELLIRIERRRGSAVITGIS